MSDWRGLAALVLAVGVAVAIVLIAVDAFRQHGRIGDTEATLLATVLGAAVGAVATYLGMRRNGD